LYWLMKSEPDECSIDDALSARDATVPWTGVRNYQARNTMRDQMQVGDGVLFYHSSCEEPGIAGIAEVARAAYPDATQFDRKSAYYDAAAKKDSPRWLHVDVRALRKTRLITIAELRAHEELADMIALRKGNRLSITPVTAAEWKFITATLMKGPPGAARPLRKRSALQAAASRDAMPPRPVHACAGGHGAAGLGPLGGTARRAKGAI
jgi:predicted RNA-binding protein with PUA-like domain